MPKPGYMIIEGQIVEIRDGQKKMTRTYTYGYRTLRVFAGVEYYSVLVNTARMNEFGFLPREGQWVRIEGRLSPALNDLYDRSIDCVSELTHIDPSEKINENQ